MKILIYLLIMLFVSCENNSKESEWIEPKEYICKENSRGNCDCCKISNGDMSYECATGNQADRIFMPCVDAIEFEYEITKWKK